MAQSKFEYEVLHQGGGKNMLTADDLSGLVDDAASWFSFLQMLRTDAPARMTMFTEDGVANPVIVGRPGKKMDAASFETA
jgi:hypothetical protein